jgi:hypothetical protein
MITELRLPVSDHRAGHRLGALEGEVWTWLDGSAEPWGPEPVGRLVEGFLVVM